MSEQQFTRPRGVPVPPNGQQATEVPGPDFLAYAADQLRRAHAGITLMAKDAEHGEGTKDVIELRLAVAAGYTELAAIQYSLPDDEGDEEDEEYDDRR
jgi:hypothetical protein